MALKLVVCTLFFVVLVVSPRVARAQSPYRVEYFANANTSGAPDATLRLDNDGSAERDLCADIFVFDTNEEMSECCSCLETPDGLRTLSVNNDLTSRPLTSAILPAGVIKIVAAATTGGTCPVPTHITLVSGGEIQSWATHIQNSTFAITEAVSQVSNLSSAEESLLAKECGAIDKVGSGNGLCSCGSGS
jgi:hypothetical protein